MKTNQAIYDSIRRVGLAAGIGAVAAGAALFYTTLPIAPLYITATLILLSAFFFSTSIAMKRNANETHHSMENTEANVYSQTNLCDANENLEAVCESEKYMELQSFHSPNRLAPISQ